jgi:hypothetical protein
MLIFFDHQRWVKNLSSQNANYPAYHNLETHSASTLADNVYVSSRHCSSHREQSGHYYCGASSCCQFYTRGVRQELIALAAFSARHSRAHDTYVQEFNKFEQKINLFHHQYRALAGTHGGVFYPDYIPC